MPSSPATSSIVPHFSALTRPEQYKVLKHLPEADPTDRLPILESALDVEATRIRTLGMNLVAQTAADLPDAALPLAERGIRDVNDRVSVAAAKAVGAATMAAPNKAVPSLEHAFTRRASVREAVGPIVVQLFADDQEASLPFLIKMAEDKPNIWRNSDHIQKVICAKPELFDLTNTQSSSPDELEQNQWRKLLERHLTVSEYPALEIAAGLIKEDPKLAINLLVLAEKIRQLQPANEEYTERQEQTQVGLFLTSRLWGGDSKLDAQYCYELIQANPEASAYLDHDIDWLNGDEFMRSRYGAGTSWLQICQAVPAVKKRLAKYFTDRTRRISDTSDEYTRDREMRRRQSGVPEIFGIGTVDVPGLETPETKETNMLETLKYRIAMLEDEDVNRRAVSQSTRAKIRYLKSLINNNEPAEVNDERLKNFLKFHIDEQMMLYREAQSYIPEWQARFLSRLPAGVDKDTVQRRVAETRIVFFDELSALTSWRGENAAGTFVDTFSIARIDLTESPLDQEKIYTHEMLHGLSGRSIIFHPDTLTNRQVVINQRVGFYIKPIDKIRIMSGKRTVRFHWLNEAVTEDLTQEMTGHSGYSTYHPERELLFLLRTCGKFEIDTDVFRKAYFENYDADLPAGERMPHWKNLQRQLKQAYGEPILLKLDKIVKKQGVRAAIDELLAR